MSKITLVSSATAEQSWLNSSGTEVSVQVHEDDKPVAGMTATRAVKLFTAHDVRGLRREVISARFPAPNARSVPLDWFPHIELCPEDLPWRYSASTSTPRAPWLMLITCPAAKVKLGRSPHGLTTLTWADEPALPDPADRASWAHVQLGADGQPARARLLCPIRLSPKTAYVAALVPATLGGVQAALGMEANAQQGELWTRQPGLVLPAFDLWRFQTTDVSLEEVARALKPFDGEAAGDPGLGQRPLSVRWPPRSGDQELEDGFTYAGALVESAVAPSIPAQASQRLFPGPGGAPPAERGPAIGPIWHGAPWAPAPTSEPASPSWSELVNLNPSMRAAAGLGRALVVEHQEELVAAAWDKLAEAREVNRALGRAELAEFGVVGTFRHRVRRLSDDGADRLGLRARGLLDGDDDHISVHQRLMNSALPAGVESAALVRRMLRGGVAAQRRVRTPSVSKVAAASSKAILGRAVAGELKDAPMASELAFVGHAFKRWAKGPLLDGPFTRMSRRVEGGGPDGVAHRKWTLQLDNPLAPWLISRHGADPLVPGLAGLPDDSVLMLKVNPNFVEALLVGANQALMEEFIWRDVPVRLGDTPLRCFWSDARPDIEPINGWSDAATSRSANGTSGAAMILRSRLVSLVPGLRIRLVRMLEGSADFTPPRWSISLGGDTLAVGFPMGQDSLGEEGWCLLLEQPPTSPRFGLDVEVFKDLKVDEGGFVVASTVGTDPNTNYQKLYQKPLRILYSTQTLFGG